MDFPTVPTDSLHKYHAVLGTILMFAGVALIAFGLYRSSETIRRGKVEIETGALLAEWGGDIVESEQRDSTDFLLMDSLLHESRAHLVRGQAELEAADSLLSDTLSYIFLGVLLGVWGLVLQGRGLSGWQESQKLEDRVLRLRVKSLERELGIEPSETDAEVEGKEGISTLEDSPA